MKIEIGESLLLSWLRHIKECQLVQTNWKSSNKWELRNKEKLEMLMETSHELFNEKYNYNIYKGNSSIDQLIRQAEIDVLGVNFEEHQNTIYAVDVAFHEFGLNYGTKEQTVTRVIMKCLRTAMCLYGYFETSSGSIVFASPKINPALELELLKCIDDINFILNGLEINYNIRIIANDDFSEKILEPVLNVLGEVADTSELFIRSLQMYNLFAKKRTRPVKPQQPLNNEKVSRNSDVIQSQGIDGLEEMKIGVIVRSVLRKVLEDGKVSKDEIIKMQTKEYSKETFDIQYPLLQKASLTNYESPIRYYSTCLKIYGEEYFLCSEWYEGAANNDRPYLIKWLALHK